MKIPHDYYVPALKFRQGEYIALERLHDKHKDRIVPLLIIPPIEFDFEEWADKTTIDEHLEKSPRRLEMKWKGRRALIKLDETLHHKTLANGKFAVEHLFDKFLSFEVDVIPAFNLTDDPHYISRIIPICQRDKKGFALVLRIEDLMQPNLEQNILGVNDNFNTVLDQIDLLIDIASTSFADPHAFAKALSMKLNSLSFLEKFRSFIIIGNSFPESFKTIQKPGIDIPRNEWIFYQSLTSNLSKDKRRPTFGDYCFETPKFQKEKFDFRVMKPAGRLIYTLADKWIVRKGKAFIGNEDQQIEHCNHILSSGHYMGVKFSYGDKYIQDCAVGKVGTGNVGVWKKVGFNHHMTFVVEELASFHAP